MYGDPVRASRDRRESDGRRNQSLWLDEDHDGTDVSAIVAVADPEWSVTLLRYFNPVGAHPSALIGELPAGTPPNLMPYVTGVAAGKLPVIRVFGTDYPTPDGTAVRDYVHVVDVAEGHVVALEKLNGRPGRHVYNLGTGRGSSVLEVIRTFSETTGVDLPWEPHPRRPGDVASTWASVDKGRPRAGMGASLRPGRHVHRRLALGTDPVRVTEHARGRAARSRAVGDARWAAGTAPCRGFD